jgi:hypothetical protein
VRTVTLREVLNPRNDIVHPRDDPSGDGIFVGLEHIEPHTGRRIGSVPIQLKHLTGRKARFFRGDIVYGYLRPYLNKVWVADFDGYCSVDQYVFRVGDGASAHYVAAFMRSPIFLESAPIRETPGQLPRIRLDEVLDVPMRLPSPEHQATIATRVEEQLNGAARLRTAATSRRQRLAELRDVVISDLVGAGSSAWPETALSQACEFITDGTHQPPPFTASGVPFLFVRNIVGGEIRFDVEKHVSEETYIQLTKKRRPERGDILYSAVGSFGTAIVVRTDRPFTFQRHIAHLRLRGDLANPDFIAAYLNSPAGRQQSEAAALGGAQRTVTLRSLGAFRIPLPPVDVQVTVAALLRARLHGLDHAAGLIETQRLAIDLLPAALLRRAFGVAALDGLTGHALDA